MAVTINSSIDTTRITSTVNDITVNVTVGASVSNLAFLEGDTLFRLNGQTEDTGFKFDTSGSAVIFYIEGNEVGRFEK